MQLSLPEILVLAVVQGVATDKYAIGYSGIGYGTADVRAVHLALNADSAAA